MSSVTLAPGAVNRPAINPWFVAVAVVMPTFMEVLDTTIANVALRYIAGGLSASNVDSEWVLTSYLAANATILPISGWLSAHLGRRNYFLLSIAVFTIASGLCGMATSLEQMILFRVIQGLAGGGLQPSSQGVLLDSFPPEKQGAAQTMFGVAALLAPVVGPTLGGYLTVNYDWRWIFYINVPVGALGFLVCYFLVRRSGLPQARAGGAAPPAAELRLHRPGAARPGHVELGSDAQQGAGVGLVQRPVLAGADAVHPVRCRAGLPDLPGDCGSPTRWSTSGRWASGTSRPPASSSSVPTACSTAPARRCRACSSPCSATTPMSRGWCSRHRAFSPSWC